MIGGLPRNLLSVFLARNQAEMRRSNSSSGCDKRTPNFGPNYILWKIYYPNRVKGTRLKRGHSTHGQSHIPAKHDSPALALGPD
jgi:hypothetical protein